MPRRGLTLQRRYGRAVTQARRGWTRAIADGRVLRLGRKPGAITFRVFPTLFALDEAYTEAETAGVPVKIVSPRKA